MRIKFNKFERVAGVFVLTAIAGTLMAGFFVAVQKGWFERKIELKTTFESAGGLNPGTQVQMSGLRIGSVESVDLVAENKVVVTFTVPHKHLSKIRQDSVVRTIRPFLIGDKVLDVTVGSEGSAPVQALAFLSSENSMDLMDLLGGRQLGEALKEMGSLMSSLKTLLLAFSDPKRANSIIQLFDQMLPLVINANLMAIEMTKVGQQASRKKNVQKIVENLVVMTGTLNKAMPQIQEAIEKSPNMASDILAVVENLAKLTNEMNKILPAIAEVAPELPKASRRAIEAMDEAVVVLKAMQKSFLLRGSASEVREEEAQRDKERAPAQTDDSK